MTDKSTYKRRTEGLKRSTITFLCNKRRRHYIQKNCQIKIWAKTKTNICYLKD